MAEFVVMPKLEASMEEGLLVRWHKKEGEKVEKDEVVFEMETDKTTMEIESTCNGVLRKILVLEGEKVPVTLPIAIIGEVDENIDDLLQEAYKKLNKGIKVEEKVEKKELPSEEPSEIDIKAFKKISPRARKLIETKKIDISQMNIKGTGFDGAISEKDVLEYLEEKESNAIKVTPVAQKLAEIEGIELTEVKGTGVNEKIMKEDVQKAIKEKQVPQTLVSHVKEEVLEEMPYTGARKVIGDRLSKSKNTAPHVYFTTSVDVTQLKKIKGEIGHLVETNVSLNDIIAGAVVRALEKFPIVNSSLEGDKILLHKNINIGIAVALDNSLIVPVIKNAQQKKISEISAISRELVEKARANNLMPSEYSGGTFTISNLGMYGIENFTAIINPPETGILAVSAIKKKPIVITEDGQDKIEIKPIMNITLSCDHRVTDGVVATKFINEIKELLENPMKILI